MTQPLVQMLGVSKRFGGVHAVQGADLSLHAGEIVALVGHNGAGKSTLVALLSGALEPDDGEIRIAGDLARIRAPRDAQRLGIETLYQDLALADNLDAVANLFLGRELRGRLGLLDQAAMEREARAAMQRVNPHFTDFRSPVRALSGGERQSVAIARAVHFEARVLILDEPTAALGPEESSIVVDQIRRLRDDGLGVLLVSHDLRDVFALADRIIVMKGGRVIGVRARAAMTPDTLLAMIISGEDRRLGGDTRSSVRPNVG